MDLQFEFPLEIRDSAAYRCVYSADDVLIAFLGHRLNGKQIAEFIVRACNRDHAFDDLVKALRTIAADDEATAGQLQAMASEALTKAGV